MNICTYRLHRASETSSSDVCSEAYWPFVAIPWHIRVLVRRGVWGGQGIIYEQVKAR